MTMNEMRGIETSQLYGILDLGYVARGDALSVTERMLEGGIDVIQLRAKGVAREEIAALGRDVHALTAAAGIPLVINDYPEIAAAIGAEGVHVGQDDGPLEAARAAATGVALAGRSTHSREQALAGEAEGADYLGFGPLFATPTKPEYTAIGLEDIRWVHERVEIPIFCIGGIKRENLQQVIDAGAKRVVIVSGILAAADISEYIRDVKTMLPPLNDE